MTVRKFAMADAPFARAPEQTGEVFLGNVIDQRHGASISVGFGRYAPDQSNSETLAFDEAMVVLEGAMTVETAVESITAISGEIVYLPKGDHVTYRSGERGAMIAYVTHPHWQETLS